MYTKSTTKCKANYLHTLFYLWVPLVRLYHMMQDVDYGQINNTEGKQKIIYQWRNWLSWQRTIGLHKIAMHNVK